MTLPIEGSPNETGDQKTMRKPYATSHKRDVCRFRFPAFRCVERAAAGCASSTAGALLGEIGGGFDSALRTGNAIGTIIEIAARMSSNDTSSEVADALQIFGAKGKYTKEKFDDRSVTETFTGWASQIASMRLYDAEGTYTKHTDAEGYVRETFNGTAGGYNDADWQQFWLEQMEAISSGGRSCLR